MHPTLLSLGNISISSFGFFLALGFVMAVFVIWRLCRVYDIDEEETLDITLLTFFGGLVGARLFFVLTNLSIFNDFLKVILIQRYPGLSFWGGVITGLLTLKLISRRFNLPFFQVADFVTVGVFGALIFGSLGCLFGSCQYGVPSNFFLAVTQVGLIGTRFPVQLLASLLYLLAFLYLWKVCLRFHFTGKVVSLGLIFLGLIKFFTEYLRGDAQPFLGGLSINQFFALASFVVGFVAFFKTGKRSPARDLAFVGKIFTDPKTRKLTLSKLSKNWYNLKVNFRLSLYKRKKGFIQSSKSILRNLNVKSNPPQL